jgi:hypothetical protein
MGQEDAVAELDVGDGHGAEHPTLSRCGNAVPGERIRSIWVVCRRHSVV